MIRVEHKRVKKVRRKRKSKKNVATIGGSTKRVRRRKPRMPVASNKDLVKVLFTRCIGKKVLIGFEPTRGATAVLIDRLMMNVTDVYSAAGCVCITGGLTKYPKIRQTVKIPTDRITFVFPSKGQVVWYTMEWGYVKFTCQLLSEFKKKVGYGNDYSNVF